MKKILWLTVVIFILCTAVLFTGCGNSKTNDTTETTNTTELTVETTQKGFEAESGTTAKNTVSGNVATEDKNEEATEATLSTTVSKTTNATTKANTSDLISQSEAQRIALEHAGVTERQATPTKIELDAEKGKYIYEIDFLAGDMEYEYDINAKTGAIISADKELVNE